MIDQSSKTIATSRRPPHASARPEASSAKLMASAIKKPRMVGTVLQASTARN